MNHNELIVQVSAYFFKKSGKIESLNSLLAMRNYLAQLDDHQLKKMLEGR